MTRKQIGLLIGAILALLLIIGGIYAYRTFFSQVNFSGFTGDGGEAGLSMPPGFSVEEFAAGWRDGSGTVSGRPVGLAVGPDGALYVSDDRGGFIYRIQYDE